MFCGIHTLKDWKFLEEKKLQHAETKILVKHLFTEGKRLQPKEKYM